MQIKSRTQETVFPSSPSPNTLLHLSNNDQIMPRLYSSVLFFFKSPTNSSQVLKTSLRELLCYFYPCAGRYIMRENGNLDVDCHHQGVPFFEVRVDSSLDAFGDFQPQPQFGLLVPQKDPNALISEIPILLVQVTHFECGGLCLGVQMHHSVCDGGSLGHFMKSWAEIASGKGLTLRPHVDRSLLKARQPPSPAFNHCEYQTVPPDLPTSWPEMTSKVFEFTPAAIDTLKETPNVEGPPSLYSGFESLAAHLWRCVTLARGLDPAEEVRLGMAVDGRKRFNPSLPEGYFGNVNFYGFAVSKAGDLVEKPLSYAAGLVHDAIARISEEYMRSALDWVEKEGSPTSIFPAFSKPFSDLAITSWSRFPFYEIDFGWGNPLCVRIPTLGFEGLIILLPSSLGHKHVDALVGLRVEHMSSVIPILNSFTKEP